MRRSHHTRGGDSAGPPGLQNNAGIGGQQVPQPNSSSSSYFPTTFALLSSVGRGRFLGSAVFVLAVVSIVVMVPPMKAKPYLAEDRTAIVTVVEHEVNKRLARVNRQHERQQVLDDPDGDMDGDGAGATKSNDLRNRKIDLTLYVVFHKQVVKENYVGIAWNDIAVPVPRSLQNSAVTASAGHTTVSQQRGGPRRGRGGMLSHQQQGGGVVHEPPPGGITTADIVSALSSPEGSDRTTILFLATNRYLRKRYDPELVRGRLLREWELPGYDSRIGASMNEFGAMNSIFASQLTQHAGNIANVAGRGTSAKLIAADADGDGVQEWVGIFQYDMHLDAKLIHQIRRRILRRTAATTAATAASPHASLPSNRTSQLQQQLHCCIFYGVSYPSKYILHNRLGRQLLADYNEFFGTHFALDDLPPAAILDAFVVPSIVFNHIAPFLESVMLRVLRKPSAYPARRRGGAVAGGASRSGTVGAPSTLSGAADRPVSTPADSINDTTTTTPPATPSPELSTAATSGGFNGGGDAQQRNLNVPFPHGLEVMEAALALALGLEVRFVQIPLPLRHKSWDG